MDITLFAGSGTALVTPFLNGELDLESFGSLIDWQIHSGTNALIICGTTGEASTMTGPEKERAISFAVERSAGRVPIIAGTGGNDTAVCLEQSLRAQELGADALLMVTPYYNKTTQAGLIAHYTKVADAVRVPIIIYNVPSRTGLNVLPSTMCELSKHPRIRGIKEASANIEQITELARLCVDSIALYSGNDDHVLPLLSLGGQGVISTVANIAPREVERLVATYMVGDIAASRALQFKLNPLVKQLFTEVNPIPVKAALQMMGKCSGELRLPLVEISETNRSALRREMLAFGLLEEPS